MNPLNIIFAGTPEFGIPCLNALNQSSFVLQAVYTQPDRPAGRGRKLQSSAIKTWALEHQIPVYQPPHFKNKDTIDELARLKPDVMIVIAYGLILPSSVLMIPKFGCINVHASLLPMWRGAAPIQHAILHGDTHSGVTIMQMDVGLDTGPMLSKVICPIEKEDTAGDLHNKLALLATTPLLATLEALKVNAICPEKQDNALASYAHKINKEDAKIDWDEQALIIDRKIRAYHPWPVAYTAIGDSILRIHQVQMTDTASVQAPGTILRIDKYGMLVATGSHDLLIKKIQFPGAKAISVAEWYNSGKAEHYLGSQLQ